MRTTLVRPTQAAHPFNRRRSTATRGASWSKRHIGTHQACERPSRSPGGEPAQALRIFAASPRSSSSTLFSRISTLRTFPVTVIGKESTTSTYRGIL